MLPKGARFLFLPQKPYFPLGSLKDTVCYPGLAGYVEDAVVCDALRRVGLGQLVDDLARVRDWGQVLSGGEQQRLAFARVLLNKPDWVFLDEATAFAGVLAEKAPLSMRFAKARLQHSGALGLETVLQLETDAILHCMDTEDWHEGVRAFSEKRKPVYRGV